MADIEGEEEVESAFDVLQCDLDALRSAILDAEYDTDSLLSQVNQIERSTEDLRFAVNLLTSFATRLASDAELCACVSGVTSDLERSTPSEDIADAQSDLEYLEADDEEEDDLDAYRAKLRLAVERVLGKRSPSA